MLSNARAVMEELAARASGTPGLKAVKIEPMTFRLPSGEPLFLAGYSEGSINTGRLDKYVVFAKEPPKGAAVALPKTGTQVDVFFLIELNPNMLTVCEVGATGAVTPTSQKMGVQLPT